MKSILVVDNSVTNLSIVESALKNEYRLTLVKSGAQALKFLSRNYVDLVLLDLLMPEMDGFETFERIKQLEHNNNVPVIFLTADVEVDSEIKGLKMGAKDFIKKPFVPEIMINRINRILQLEELTKNLEEKVKEKTKQIEQLSFEIMTTVASMIEAKDSYTKGHSVRVAEYSALLAKEMGWNDDEIQNLKNIAVLHDIGKVGIPDTVLNKPGKLSEIEFNIIKSHTTLGGDILKDIETIPDVDAGAKYHHERYDGKGYPCGLAGNDIPEVARIICIADAYDAMNSKRIYRDSLPREIIRQELLNGRDSQFDPNMLDVFVRLFDEDRIKIEENSSKEKTVSGEGSVLLNQIMNSIEAEAQKTESSDFLTGLYNRKKGEAEIAKAMQKTNGCLAFIDLDNLKRINDTMGHLAGDYAIMAVGEVLASYNENTIAARLGGDEFLFYMIGADEQMAIATIESIMDTFDKKKEGSPYLSVASLSIGLCLSTTEDTFADVLEHADKALYHVKQSGKCGYYFHVHANAAASVKKSVDLKKLVNNLQKSGSYTGSLSVEYREFAKIYDFIQHLVERYDYNMQLIMLTLGTGDVVFDTAQKEDVMSCLESAIKNSLRSVDVSTRFSSEEFLIVLLNAEENDVQTITNRVFEKFYKMYDGKGVQLSYDIANLSKME